jgi:hypothetical protein
MKPGNPLKQREALRQGANSCRFIGLGCIGKRMI